MSQVMELLRKVTGGWPRSGSSVTRPLRAPWNRGAARPQSVAAGTQSDASPVVSAAELRIEHFWQAPVYADRIEHLFDAFQLAPLAGHVLEFGVYRGATLNRFAEWSSDRSDPRVFGFDSFEGLPEEWVRTKAGYRYQAGHFSLGRLPCVLENVELIPGFFDATLAPWLAKHPGPIAFLHNDSDLYSSTLHCLRTLNDRLVPGTVIAFDELGDWTGTGVYDNWDEGEWKALREWLSEFDRRIKVISRNCEFGAVVQVVQ